MEKLVHKYQSRFIRVSLGCLISQWNDDDFNECVLCWSKQFESCLIVSFIPVTVLLLSSLFLSTFFSFFPPAIPSHFILFIFFCTLSTLKQLFREKVWHFPIVAPKETKAATYLYDRKDLVRFILGWKI